MQRTELSISSPHFFNVLGVRFNRVTPRDAVETIMHWIHEKSRRMVITAGPEFVMKAKVDESLLKMAFVADMVTPDGIGIVWAAKRQGIKAERVTGVELVEAVLNTAKDRNIPLRVFILGANEASLKRCLQVFRQSYSNMVFAGRNGYFTQADVPTIREEIERFEPDLWLVGLGQPRQERLIFESLAGLPPCVGIGVGGSIDVWGGTVKRAPALFRKARLEWLFRLLKEPSRWRRQLALPRFAWKILRSSGRNIK